MYGGNKITIIMIIIIIIMCAKFLLGGFSLSLLYIFWNPLYRLSKLLYT